jgi:hypothetical protein
MKRFLTATLLVAILTALCFAYGQAQTFAGLSWEGQPGLVYGGKVINISEKLNTLGYFRLALDKDTYSNGFKTNYAIAAKLTYHIFDRPTWDLYLHGGGSVDWADPTLEQTDIVYITQSIGGTLVTPCPSFIANLPVIKELDEPRLWVAGEWRPQLTETSLWNNWPVSFGAGLSWGLPGL